MHKINMVLDKYNPKKDCDSKCKYYTFDHLTCACVLSDVYSVNKGEPCAIYADKNI